MLHQLQHQLSLHLPHTFNLPTFSPSFVPTFSPTDVPTFTPSFEPSATHHLLNLPQMIVRAI